MKNKKVTLIPLVLCEVYWILSYIIYRFGVMEHPFKMLQICGCRLVDYGITLPM